jgi:hypothetical protein
MRFVSPRPWRVVGGGEPETVDVRVVRPRRIRRRNTVLAASTTECQDCWYWEGRRGWVQNYGIAVVSHTGQTSLRQTPLSFC